VSGEIYIGKVEYIRDNPETGYRHAGLDPLFSSSDDQKNWLGPVENAQKQFPGRGLVNWHMPPTGLKEGAYRQFEVGPHPNYKGELNKEAFQVTNIDYPSEVIDLRSFGKESDIRALLCSKGVILSYSPLVERSFLWVSNDKIIGPVNLSKRPGTKSWIFSESQDLAQVRCWKPEVALIQSAEIDGDRFLLIPNQKNPGEFIRLETWEPDEVLAKRLLKHLRKLDRELPKALGITDKVFNAYVEVIEKSGLLGATSPQELNYYERIKDIFNAIEMNTSLLEEAADVCFAIDPIKEEMEAKAKEEYEKKLSDYEAQLDADLAIKNRKIKDAETELDEKKSELASLQGRITTAEQKLAKQVDKFDLELREKLREVAGKPERLFAEMAFIGAISSAIRPGFSVASPETSRLNHIVVPETPAIREPSALVGVLSQRLLSSGISPQVGQELHCALTSGAVPVVIGPDGLDVIRSYANCVSGGMLHWIPIGGTLFEPTDLLGRIDPSSRSLLPHPSGLLDLLLDDSDAVHLVVLDGFNRSAADGYLLPLIQLLQDAAEGRDRLAIPLVPPSFSRNEDPYSAVHRVSWSRNVLLVLRPITGSSALPVPRDLWAHCAAINTELSAGVIESPEQSSRVAKKDWNMWFDQALSLSEPIEKLSEHPKTGHPLPQVIRRKIERLYGAGMALGLAPDRATKQALKLGLVPYLVTYDEPLDEWSSILGLELEEQDRRVEDIVRRLEE
jgi:hypothetical protein